MVSGININKWVDEAQACMWAHCLSTADQAFFLFDNLEGEDWEEIRHCPELEREDLARIIVALSKLYDCSLSNVAL